MVGDGVFRVYAVDLDGTFIDEVIDARGAPNVDVELMAPLGGHDVTVSLLKGAQPTLSFSTLKVGTALAAVGIDGLDVSSGLAVSWIEKAVGGKFHTAGQKLTAAKCLVVPTGIRCSADGNAQIDYVGHCYSANGTTHPLASGTTLLAGTPAVTEVFGLGTCLVGGVPLGQVLDMSIDTGNQVEVLKESHHVYPTIAHLVEPRQASITLRCRDLGEVSDARLVGAELPVVVNLLKKSLTGGGWAGAGNKSLTATKAFVTVQDLGADGVALQCRVRKEGANAILIVGS